MEFQGLLEEEEATPYPNLSTEPPGVELEREEAKLPPSLKKTNQIFDAGIIPDVRIRAANNYINNNAEQQGPAFIEANQDQIVYESPLISQMQVLPQDRTQSLLRLISFVPIPT